MKKKRLTILQSIEIASPCPLKREALPSHLNDFHCHHCSKHVYSLSDRTPLEALSALRRNEGDLCVRLQRASDGSIAYKESKPRKRLREGAPRLYDGLKWLVPSMFYSTHVQAQLPLNSDNGGISDTPNLIFSGLIEGSFSALLMMFCALVFVPAGLVAYKKKSKKAAVIALCFFVIALMLLVLRILSPILFGEHLL